MKPQARERLAGYLFIAPTFIFYAAFALVPLMGMVLLTVFSLNRFTLAATYVGLEKFEWVYLDPRFWQTFFNTFYFISLAVVGNVGLGLVLALALNRAMPKVLLYLFRLAYFFPVLVATAFVSYIWQFLYANDFGVLNYFLRSAGLPAVGWLTDTRMVMISVVIMDVWKHVGFFMIILLAALQGVPRELVEAATVDGASSSRIFWHITLPYIAPVLLFCITYCTIGGLQVFDSIRILTEGGPGDSTRSVVLYMFEEAFSAGDLSAGAIAALTLLVVISLVAGLQFYIGRRWAA